MTIGLPTPLEVIGEGLDLIKAVWIDYRLCRRINEANDGCSGNREAV